MPTTSAHAHDEARWQQLRARVADHKSAIRHHREQLGAAKAALVAFEAECRQRGIHLIVTQPHGEGSIHGR